MGIFTKKDFDSVKEASSSSGLAQTLTAFDLVMLGLGAIIGTGVFVLTGTIAANHAGPAVMLSYAIAGMICVFIALSYTELAAMLPTSGSVYTYSYIAYGEMIAWIIGSMVVLELTIGAATVAAGWSAYMQGLLAAGGIPIPAIYGAVPAKGGLIDLPALFIVCFITFILYLGTKDSKRVNAILDIIKMLAILVFTVTAIPNFEVEYWHDFMPFGFDDVLIGSSVLFFAFTGFGTLASAAEECKNPSRDLTIGIIGSLRLST